jgi:hypothetical protein
MSLCEPTAVLSRLVIVSLVAHNAGHELDMVLFPMATKPIQGSKIRIHFGCFASIRLTRLRLTKPTYTTNCRVQVEDVGYIRHPRAKLATGCAALEEAQLDSPSILGSGCDPGPFADLFHSYVYCREQGLFLTSRSPWHCRH